MRNLFITSCPAQEILVCSLFSPTAVIPHLFVRSALISQPRSVYSPSKAALKGNREGKGRLRSNLRQKVWVGWEGGRLGH